MSSQGACQLADRWENVPQNGAVISNVRGAWHVFNGSFVLTLREQCRAECDPKRVASYDFWLQHTVAKSRPIRINLAR